MTSPPPRVSVCLIVRNEEACLGRAMRSVARLAHEFVVVDTGSADRTVAIAESFGARVYHHPWRNNFSLHRNQACGYAQGDWIFQIDADEELAPEGVGLLQAALAATRADAILLPIHSVAEGGAQESGHNSLRLFRNGRGIRYEGAVHNEVVFSGEAQFVPARLLHHGYNLSREKMLAKFKRTTDILVQEMERDPANPKYPHYLAVSFHTERRFREALELAERSAALCGADREAHWRWIANYYLIAACRLEFNDLPGAKAACVQALEIYGDYLDAYAVLTSIAFKAGDAQALQDCAERYLALHQAHRENAGRFGTVPLHTLSHRPLVLLRLALSARRPGGGETLWRARYAEALDAARDPGETALSAARYVAATGDPAGALALLEEGLARQPRHAELLEQRFRLLLELKRPEEAEAALAEARQNGLARERADLMQGLADLVAGRGEAARAAFEKLAEENPADAEARLNLALTLERLDRPPEAERAYLALLEHTPHAPQAAQAAENLAGLCQRAGRLSEAVPLVEQALAADGARFDLHFLLLKLFFETDDAERLLSHGRAVAAMLGTGDPGALDSVATLGWMFLEAGRILAARHDRRASLIALELAQTFLPDEPEAFLACGRERLAAGRARAAIESFEQAARLAPQRREPFEGLLAACEALGLADAAAVCREQLAKLDRP